MGDIIQPETRFDLLRLWISAFVLQWVAAEHIVCDIVKMLHPHANLQQKAAAKLDGTRLFLVGWPDKYMYRVESAKSVRQQYPIIILKCAFLTVAKAFWAYQRGSWLAISFC